MTAESGAAQDGKLYIEQEACTAMSNADIYSG